VLEELLEILYRPITARLENLMTTAEELSTKLETLQTELEEAKSRITADVDELRRLIEASVDPAALDELSARLDSITANVQSIDPDPQFPPPTA
jgi:predicted nuclease with TOPRIM domain